MPSGDLYVPQVDAGVEHGGHEGVPEHVGVHPGQANASDGRKLAEPAGCSVPVHPQASPVEQERAIRALARGPVDRAADGRRERDQDDLAALAADPEDSVPVLLAEVVDVCADGLEDPQPEKAKQADKREVEGVGRLPAGAEHGFKLQVRQP